MHSSLNSSWSHLPFLQELGITSRINKQKIGSFSRFIRHLSGLYCVNEESAYDFNHLENNQGTFHGSILNLSFSPGGHILTAATENKSILLFDPLCHRLIHHVNNAHSDSVNCIKFIDDHIFTSASDDATVNLWDCRMLKQRIKQLNRYPNPVKHLEYDIKSRCLIVTTTDYDGSIYLCPVFDTNSDRLPSKILHVSCVMKCKLTPDGSKLIFGTTEGYLMAIHDLDLTKITMDLSGFQSDLYRLMQRCHSFGFDFGSWFNCLFEAQRNRVELISDFPHRNDAHVITSFDVHPYGWCILSRNVTRTDESEYTCIHDIQDDIKPHKTMPISTLAKDTFVHTYEHPHRRLPPSNNSTSVNNQSTGENTTGEIQVAGSSSSVSSTSSLSEIPDLPMSPVVIISARSLNRRAHATILTPNSSYREIKPNQPPPHIYTNLPRLMYFTPEPKASQAVKDYAREPSFSKDGRLIVSPFLNGYRLLSFDHQCSELSSTYKSLQLTGPQRLFEIKKVLPSQGDVCLTTKFSPTHELIALGSFDGRVVFSQPCLS